MSSLSASHAETAAHVAMTVRVLHAVMTEVQEVHVAMTEAHAVHVVSVQPKTTSRTTNLKCSKQHNDYITSEAG
jgi:hypothetical protein